MQGVEVCKNIVSDEADVLLEAAFVARIEWL